MQPCHRKLYIKMNNGPFNSGIRKVTGAVADTWSCVCYIHQEAIVWGCDAWQTVWGRTSADCFVFWSGWVSCGRAVTKLPAAGILYLTCNYFILRRGVPAEGFGELSWEWSVDTQVHDSWLKKETLGAGEMAQEKKHLPRKCKDLCLGSQDSHKCQMDMVPTCDLSILGKLSRRSPEQLSRQPNQIKEFWIQMRMPCLTK